jgi:hypothetical protein
VLVALVPPADMTVTSTLPALAAGDIAVIEVELLTVKCVDGVVPKFTAVAPVKPVPVIVIVVPPAAGPEVTEMLVTLGAGTKPDARSSFALFDWLYASLPYLSKAEKVGLTAGTAESTMSETTAPVKSHVTPTQAE